MRFLYYKTLILLIISVVFIPSITRAFDLPSNRFILYKDGKPIEDYESVILECNIEEPRSISDRSRGHFVMRYCGYGGEIDPEETTILQVKNNHSDKITHLGGGYLTPPDDDYLYQLDVYYKELAKKADKSITVNIKPSDNIEATTEDRYYAVDVDTGKIGYLPKGRESYFSPPKILPIYLAVGLAILLLTTVIILGVARKKE